MILGLTAELLTVFVVLMSPTISPSSQANDGVLKRQLFLFANSPSDPAFRRQLAIFSGHRKDLIDRDLEIVPVFAHATEVSLIPFDDKLYLLLNSSDSAEARRDLHALSPKFTVLLIGKDGGEKLRAHTPISIEKLTTTIDAMPMRQDEMKRKK